MKTMTAMLISVFVLLGVTAGWAQTSAPPAPPTSETTPGTPPGGSPPQGTAPQAPPDQPGAAMPRPESPGQPGAGTTPGSEPRATAPDRPASPGPGAQAPGAPDQPGDRSVTEPSRVFGMSPMAALILGIAVVAVIIGLIAMSARRDTDIVVKSRAGLGDEPTPRSTHESEIERERRRRAS